MSGKGYNAETRPQQAHGDPVGTRPDTSSSRYAVPAGDSRYNTCHQDEFVGYCVQATFIAVLSSTAILLFFLVPYMLLHLHSPCQTPSCEINEQLLRRTINTNIHPCNDFYNFVCSNWPSEGDGQTTLEILETRTRSKFLSSLIRDSHRPRYQSAKQKAAMLYSSCVLGILRGEHYLTELRGFMNKHQLGFPERQPTTSEELKRILVGLSFKSGIPVFLSVVVYHTLSKPTQPVFMIGPEDYWERWSTELQTMREKNTLYQYLRDLCDIVGEPGQSYSAIVKDVLAAQELIVDFQKNHNLMPRKVQLSDAGLRLALNEHLPKEAQLWATDVYYDLGPTLKVLDDRSFHELGKLRLIAGAFVVWYYSTATSSRLHNLRLEALNRSASVKIDALRRCEGYLRFIMPGVFWRITADEFWVDGTVSALRTFFNSTKNTVGNIISRTALHDSESGRQRLRDHWSFLKLMFGNSEDIPSWVELDKRTEVIPDLTWGPFLTMYDAAIEAFIGHIRVSFLNHSIVIKQPTPLDFQESKYWSLGQKKAVPIPRQYTLSPLYHPEMPRAWNYGTLGLQIAEKMVLYLQDYAYLNSKDIKTYMALSHSSFISLKEYYLCLRSELRWVNPAIYRASAALPLLLQAAIGESTGDFLSNDFSFSSAQLFFVASCSHLCSEPGDIEARASCNGLATHSVDFAEAFHCQPNAPMHPARKCRMRGGKTPV